MTNSIPYADLYRQALEAIPFTRIPYEGMGETMETIETLYPQTLECVSAEHWFVIADPATKTEQVAVGTIEMHQEKGQPYLSAVLHVSPPSNAIGQFLPDGYPEETRESTAPGTWLQGAYNMQEHRWEFSPTNAV